MFARKVTAPLKPNSISRFNLVTEQQIAPKLRNQNGFPDSLVFFAPSADAVTVFS